MTLGRILLLLLPNNWALVDTIIEKTLNTNKKPTFIWLCSGALIDESERNKNKF